MRNDGNLKKSHAQQSISVTFILLFAVSILNLQVVFAQNTADKIYQCTATEAVSVNDDGTLSRDLRADVIRKFDGIIIATLTGVITRSSGSSEVWSIVQKGNSEVDYVLVFPSLVVERSAKEAALTGASDFIRVRDWQGRQVTFTAVSNGRTFVIGSCKVVG
jgi:hypothetical protein